jgi:hypothetical protein
VIVGHSMLHIVVGRIATCTDKSVRRTIVNGRIAGPSPVAVIIVTAVIAISVKPAAVSIAPATIETSVKRTIESTPSKTISKPKP